MIIWGPLTQVKDAVIDDQSKIRSVSIERILGGVDYLSLGLALVMLRFVEPPRFSDPANDIKARLWAPL
ncbi:hypothetical protein SAMN05216428_11563 [Nitrosospira sp. Nsp11]|nr:hypothetical protein SAMN05216428_11563 [Nitrosospira sp. Nsp11]